MNATTKPHNEAEKPPLTRVYPPVADAVFSLGTVILTYEAFEAIRDAHRLLDKLLVDHVLGEGSDIRDTQLGLRVTSRNVLPTGVNLQVVTEAGLAITTWVRIAED